MFGLKKFAKQFALSALLAGTLFCSAAKTGEAEPKNQKSASLEQEVNKVLLSKKFLLGHPSLWQEKLTYEENGETLHCIPSELMDHQYSEESPELSHVELVQKGEDVSLRRWYVNKRRGKEFHDEVPISDKVEERVKDYLKRKRFDVDKRYKYTISPAVGIDPEGMYTELGVKYELDPETSFAVRVYVGKRKYELDLEAENKGESIIVGRSKSRIKSVGDVPEFYRTDWSLGKLVRKNDRGHLMRVIFSEEKARNEAKRGLKFGDWEEDDCLKRVEYGETFIKPQNWGLMYLFGHDGRDPGALVSISYREGNSEQSIAANNEVLLAKLYSKNHDDVVTGDHTVKGVLDLGYWHGNMMAQGTGYILKGQVGLFAGFGRSTETYPIKLYGKDGSFYKGIAVGGGAITNLFEKAFNLERPEGYRNSMFREFLNNVSVIFAHSNLGWEWYPKLSLQNLKMKESYRSGR